MRYAFRTLCNLSCISSKYNSKAGSDFLTVFCIMEKNESPTSTTMSFTIDLWSVAEPFEPTGVIDLISASYLNVWDKITLRFNTRRHRNDLAKSFKRKS